MASPTPVLPLVGSTIVPPGRSSPDCSAASIIRSAIRSFTDPPGLRYSTLASTSGRQAGGHRGQLDQRGVADQLDHRPGVLHLHRVRMADLPAPGAGSPGRRDHPVRPRTVGRLD